MPLDNLPNSSDEVLHEILKAIQTLRFGSIEITVHDGRVTQIERREKVRFGQETSTKKSTDTKPTISIAAK